VSVDPQQFFVASGIAVRSSEIAVRGAGIAAKDGGIAVRGTSGKSTTQNPSHVHPFGGVIHVGRVVLVGVRPRVVTAIDGRGCDAKAGLCQRLACGDIPCCGVIAGTGQSEQSMPMA